MNPTYRTAKSLGLLFCLVALFAAGPATKPTAKPAVKPAASQPVGTPATMADDQIHFLAPLDPWKSYEVKTPDTAYFQDAKGESALQAQWAPKDFQLSSDTAGSYAVTIMKDLKKKHQDAKEEMLIAPKILRDSRFDIVIYEKFKVGADGKVTEDQMHLYKSIGPRVMMVTVSCLVDDADKIKAGHKAAEDLLVSCKFNRKAFKKQ